jgi:hypothetical protein
MVLLFALFAMIAFVVVKASPRGSDYEKKRAEVRAKKLDDARKEYLPAMTTYAWADKAKGVVRVPIEHAMQLTVAQLAGSKPAAAGPIAVPAPSAAPQTSPGPSAAASPVASAAPNATATPAAKASATPAADISTTPKPKSVEGHDSESRAQPAAAINPPPAPPNTQPGPNASPNASVPAQSAKAPATPSPAASPAGSGTPLPVRGKTP